MNRVKTMDSELSQLFVKELDRQENSLSLIASENYAPESVLLALSNVLTNKYAEGYPGKRYYGGCQVADQVELLAQQRCKELFGTDYHCNVQPHSGSNANLAVYQSVLKAGDTIMGMGLSEGGHLTHGHPLNFSGTHFNIVSYGVNPETELIDYDEIKKLAQKHKPKLIIAGASAYSRLIDFKQFAHIAQSVGAYLMADIAHIAGLIAVGLHESPIPYADFITSTTHKTLRGPRGGLIMCKQEHERKIDRAVMPGIQGGPLMHVIAAKALGFMFNLQEDFTDYQKQTVANAQAMSDRFKQLGYRVIADGTDNHLFILDVRSKNITGKHAEEILQSVGIIVNRNTIPFDTQPPTITSGIRLGTPAATTRGMKESDVITIAGLMDAVLCNPTKEVCEEVAQKVQQILQKFPIYSQQYRDFMKLI